MLCEALVDLVETNYYPIRASVTNRPPSVQSASCKENLLLPSCTKQMHEKEAQKSLLGTSGDGSQAGDQGRRSIAEDPQLVFQLHGGSTLSTFAAVVVAPKF